MRRLSNTTSCHRASAHVSSHQLFGLTAVQNGTLFVHKLRRVPLALVLKQVVLLRQAILSSKGSGVSRTITPVLQFVAVWKSWHKHLLCFDLLRFKVEVKCGKPLSFPVSAWLELHPVKRCQFLVAFSAHLVHYSLFGILTAICNQPFACHIHEADVSMLTAGSSSPQFF